MPGRRSLTTCSVTSPQADARTTAARDTGTLLRLVTGIDTGVGARVGGAPDEAMEGIVTLTLQVAQFSAK